MFNSLSKTIEQFLNFDTINADRKVALQPLIDFIQSKQANKEAINLNFICTHNSRRSHLAQIWAQVAAYYYGVEKLTTYSGGTEETALFPKVAEILSIQGFSIASISEGNNPIYAIKYTDNIQPIIGFSKKHDHSFNPISNFAAIITCSQADDECPFIVGAETRISIPFEDPKASDYSSIQDKVYTERSLQIAAEMFYVFSQI